MHHRIKTRYKNVKCFKGLNNYTNKAKKSSLDKNLCKLDLTFANTSFPNSLSGYPNCYLCYGLLITRKYHTQLDICGF